MTKHETASDDSDTATRRAVGKVQLAAALAYAPVLLASVVQVALLLLVLGQGRELWRSSRSRDLEEQTQRARDAAKELEIAARKLSDATDALNKAAGTASKLARHDSRGAGSMDEALKLARHADETARKALDQTEQLASSFSTFRIRGMLSIPGTSPLFPNSRPHSEPGPPLPASGPPRSPLAQPKGDHQ